MYFPFFIFSGASLTDLTSKLPYVANACSENEQIKEQTAAFKMDAILENSKDTVLHDIM
jgi:hypothetical protein